MVKKLELPAKFRSGFIATMDGRTDLQKRLSFTYSRVIDDAGGIDAMPHAKLCLAERFAWLEEFLRQIEMDLVKGPVDRADLLGKWTQAVNSMSGLAKLLGVVDRSRRDNVLDALYAPDPEDDPATPPTSPARGEQAEGPVSRAKTAKRPTRDE